MIQISSINSEISFLISLSQLFLHSKSYTNKMYLIITFLLYEHPLKSKGTYQSNLSLNKNAKTKTSGRQSLNQRQEKKNQKFFQPPYHRPAHQICSLTGRYRIIHVTSRNVQQIIHSIKKSKTYRHQNSKILRKSAKLPKLSKQLLTSSTPKKTTMDF